MQRLREQGATVQPASRGSGGYEERGAPGEAARIVAELIVGGVAVELVTAGLREFNDQFLGIGKADLRPGPRHARGSGPDHR